MNSRFCLRFGNRQIPTHGLLAPVAVLFTFAMLIVFALAIELLNALPGISRHFMRISGRFHV